MLKKKRPWLDLPGWGPSGFPPLLEDGGWQTPDMEYLLLGLGAEHWLQDHLLGAIKNSGVIGLHLINPSPLSLSPGRGEIGSALLRGPTALTWSEARPPRRRPAAQTPGTGSKATRSTQTFSRHRWVFTWVDLKCQLTDWLKSSKIPKATQC